MKILIYGGKGWIGSQFTMLVENTTNHTIVHGHSRADDDASLTVELQEVNPSHVVSFNDKVYPTIDYLEQKGKLIENVRDNLFAPVTLALLCKKYKIHLTYLGTGCILTFDEDHPYGEESTGFTEDSLPKFFGSSYSTAKGFTDRLMYLIGGSALNLPIRMPIVGEDNPRNFITKITCYDKICSIPNSMSVLPDLLPLVVDMMQNNVTGTVNLTNPGLISHNEILTMYKEYVDPDFTWTSFTAEEQTRILDYHRSNNCLNTDRLQSMYKDVPHIKDSIRSVLQNYKTYNIILLT